MQTNTLRLRSDLGSRRRAGGLRLAPLAAVVWLVPLVAADKPVRDHDITVDDYASVAIITGCVLAPDGQRVAYTDLRWDEATDRRALDIWVTSVTNPSPQRLTFDPASDRSPHWSPDGRWIYFLSSRKRAGEDSPPYNGKTQVWRIGANGLNLTPVTRFEKGLSGYTLSKDGRTLYYLVHRDQDIDDWKDLRGKHKEIVTATPGSHKVSEIWKLNLNTWRTEKLVDDGRYIRGFAVSPDQRRIAMHTTPDELLINNEGWSRVDVYDAKTGKIAALPDELYRKNVRSPYGWIEELAWSDDSQALAFTVGWDGYPNEVYVAEWQGAQPAVRRLERPADETSVGGALHWRPRSRDLCFLVEWRARQHVGCIQDVRDGKQGRYMVLTPGDIVVHAYSFSESGKTLAIVMSDPGHARDVYLVRKPGRYARLSDANPQMATWKLPQISLVRWKGARGDEVEGVLELPFGYDPKTDGPLPMIVEIHGGPTASTQMGFRFWCYGRTIMPANGYALLSPNYRGSTGYGDKFMTELIGHENNIEVEDILAGVRAMIDRGIADPDRLGVMGWSNGGFLTNALIARTTMFKAASSGAGIADMLIQWGIEDTPGHVVNFMEGLPWQNPDAYRAASPIWHMADTKTPTLIHVGGSDARVPVPHSRTLYRALHKYLDVPSMLLVYPDQGHGLGRCSMRQAKMEWDLAWFKRYILGEDD